MRALATGAGIVLLLLLVATRFERGLPAGERGFVRRWTALAFLAYAGLFYWTYQVYLQGEFLAGDSEGYHRFAIVALRALRSGDFLLRQNPIALHYLGYPAYFIAPIYALGGADPRLPVLLNFVLLLHAAILVYRMLAATSSLRGAARYAWLFVLVNPVAVSLALYLRKDILILWLLTIVLHAAVGVRRDGARARHVFAGIAAFLALTFLRLPYALMAMATFLAALALRVLRTPGQRLLLLPPAAAVVAFLARDTTTSVLAGAESYMSSSYFEDTVFAGAATPWDALLRAAAAPVVGVSYAARVLLGVFGGGFAPIRGLPAWREALEMLQLDRIGSGLGALWGMSMLPVTLSGLWVLRRDRRTGLMPLFLFTGMLMVTLFVIGYGSRWGLPGLLLAAVCWGVGWRRLLERKSEVLGEATGRPGSDAPWSAGS